MYKTILVIFILFCGFLLGHNYEWAKNQVFGCTCVPQDVIIVAPGIFDQMGTFKQKVCKGHPEYPPSMPEWLWLWMAEIYHSDVDDGSGDRA